MSTNSFKTKNSLVLTPRDLTTLPTPEAGELACDINDGNKIKQYNPTTSTWDEIGSSQLQNVDALFLQDFEIDELSEFTQTGLAIVKTNPIRGKASAQLIHQAATSQSFKQILSVPLKFRGALATSSVVIQSSAPEGDVTIQFTCETTSTVLSSQSIQTDSQLVASLTTTNLSPTVSGFDNVTINSLYAGMVVTGTGIPTGTRISVVNSSALTITLSNNATASGTVSLRFSSVPETRSFSFTIPSTCQSLSYTITALQESGSPETYIDDIFIGLNSVPLLETSVEVPNVTAWQGYVPTFQGFGTPSNVEFEWRQVGESVEIRGKFVSGTPNTSEARVGLPNAYISAGTSLIPSIQIAGIFARGATSTAKGGVVLIEPSVSYVTFSDSAVFSADTINPLTKESGQNIVAVGDTISFYVSIPCAGLSATSAKVIELTQSGLIQEDDSIVRLSGGTFSGGFMTFTTIAENQGDAFSVNPSTGTITVLKDGTYTISSSAIWQSGTTGVGIYINGTYYSGYSLSASVSTRIPQTVTAKLTANTAIRIINPSTGTVADGTLVVTYQGSLKQVTVNSDQKIEIPTSELKFTGASAKGSTATTIVRFDNLSTVRGDAFTVYNTAADGTYIVMNKAGKLDASASIFAGTINSQLAITKNQASLTGAATANEVFARGYTNNSNLGGAAGSAFVNVGDIIRVSMVNALVAESSSFFSLVFQEQDIAVSVTNTLPQFSESDSSIRLDTANGFGSVGTKIRRFSNLRDNIGGDIEYLDSASNGASFTVKTSGVYSISYSDDFSANSTVFGISKNTSSLTTNFDSLSTSEKLVSAQIGSTVTEDNANCSWTGYLVAGDIIRPHSNGSASAVNNRTMFTITKIGKPNVTGVDVTPFVNVQLEQTQSSYVDIATTVTSANLTGPLSSSNGSGIYTYNSSTGVYTFAKKCIVYATYSLRASVAPARPQIIINDVTRSIQNTMNLTNYYASCSWSGEVNVGDALRFHQGQNSADIHVAYLLATTSSDSILTPNETFSTDTAQLNYASSALYTLSTLQNAPVGTYITFTYAANTNTRTQTTTRPTQTDLDMNTNGMLIYTRAYNAASTAAQPAAIAIQIGKGFKGKSLNLYKNASKTTSGEIGFTVSGSTGQSGLYFNSYDEKTGILYLDSGACTTGSIGSNVFFYTDTTNQVSGYLVINASKNPALTGLGLGTVAARGVSTNGQTTISGTTTMFYDSAKNYDTHNALNTSTGVFTCPEDGYYQASWGLLLAAAAGWGAGERIFSYLSKNGNAHALGTYVVIEVAGSYSMGSIGSTGLYLKKNDVISILIEHNNGASINLSTGSGNNFFSVHKTSLNTGN